MMNLTIHVILAIMVMAKKLELSKDKLVPWKNRTVPIAYSNYILNYTHTDCVSTDWDDEIDPYYGKNVICDTLYEWSDEPLDVDSTDYPMDGLYEWLENWAPRTTRVVLANADTSTRFTTEVVRPGITNPLSIIIIEGKIPFDFFLKKKVEWSEDEFSGTDEDGEDMYDTTYYAAYQETSLVERIKRYVSTLRKYYGDETTVVLWREYNHFTLRKSTFLDPYSGYLETFVAEFKDAEPLEMLKNIARYHSDVYTEGTQLNKAVAEMWWAWTYSAMMMTLMIIGIIIILCGVSNLKNY